MKKFLMFTSLLSLSLLTACGLSQTETTVTNEITQCGTEVIQPAPIQKSVILSSESSDLVKETDKNYDPNSFRIDDMRSCFQENFKNCHAAQLKHVEFQTNKDGIQEKLVTRALLNNSCKIILQSHIELPNSIKDNTKTNCDQVKLEGKKDKETLTIFDCEDKSETSI